MSRYKIIFVVVFILTHLFVNAQDPHFSQYFSSPLLMNPAFTGNASGVGRIGIQYRQQWRGIGDPFITGVVSYDGRVLKEQLSPDDKLGVGIVGIYDKSSAGALKSNYALLSLAYHKGLDEDGNQSLALGFQGTLGHRQLDFNKISFYNQFGSDGFNLTTSNGENFRSSGVTYLDFNIGGLYTFEDEGHLYYLGASYYHIPRPLQSFLGDTAYKLPSRYTIHSGATINVGESGRFSASGLFMRQGKVNESILGLAYSIFLPSANESFFTLGLWHRLKESVYPYIGFQNASLQFGLSYDITTSKLALSNSKNYSIELSATYQIPDRKVEKRLIPWY